MMLRPTAIATRPGTQEVLVSYTKQTGTNYYLAGSDIGRVCYRKSMDGGNTYGPEICGITSAQDSYRNGLTATYDPYSACFLIAYIGGVSKPIKVWTVPANGSATPTNVVTYQISAGEIDASSWHAPSIACSGIAGGCRVVFEDATNAGTVKWFKAGVDILGRLASASSVSSAGLYSYDTPSVVWSGPTDFIMAVSSKSNAAYAYVMTSTGSSWSGIGDIWNDASSYISTVVLTDRRTGTPLGNYSQGWWLRYRP
jgi:hypothetical protein